MTVFSRSQVLLAGNHRTHYIIAIGASHPQAIFNWIIWDFQLKQLKAWPHRNIRTYNQEIDGSAVPCESSNMGLLPLGGET
jgi:hypothetical protein